MKLGIDLEMQAFPERLEKAVDRATFENLRHAAASIRKAAQKSIKRRRSDTASPPGSPPFTHRGSFYRRAVLFDVSKQMDDAIIGFSYARIGDVGAVHEFGLEREGANYPERPTIGPALEESIPRLGDIWRGSIGA